MEHPHSVSMGSYSFPLPKCCWTSKRYAAVLKFIKITPRPPPTHSKLLTFHFLTCKSNFLSKAPEAARWPINSNKFQLCGETPLEWVAGAFRIVVARAGINGTVITWTDFGREIPTLSAPLFRLLTIQRPCTASPRCCTSPEARRCVGAWAYDRLWLLVSSLRRKRKIAHIVTSLLSCSCCLETIVTGVARTVK